MAARGGGGAAAGVIQAWAAVTEDALYPGEGLCLTVVGVMVEGQCGVAGCWRQWVKMMMPPFAAASSQQPLQFHMLQMAQTRCSHVKAMTCFKISRAKGGNSLVPVGVSMWTCHLSCKPRLGCVNQMPTTITLWSALMSQIIFLICYTKPIVWIRVQTQEAGRWHLSRCGGGQNGHESRSTSVLGTTEE